MESIQNQTKEFLNKMGFDVEVEVVEQDKSININCEKHAILIGKKGENLRALQYLLNTVFKKQDPTVGFYSVDVAGYKASKIEKLHLLAHESAKEVTLSGREKRLPKMNAYERRQIHMVLADDTDVITESEGEEPNRIVVIKKR